MTEKDRDICGGLIKLVWNNDLSNINPIKIIDSRENRGVNVGIFCYKQNI